MFNGGRIQVSFGEKWSERSNALGKGKTVNREDEIDEASIHVRFRLWFLFLARYDTSTCCSANPCIHLWQVPLLKVCNWEGLVHAYQTVVGFI